MFHIGENLILSITVHENRRAHHLSEQSTQIFIVDIFLRPMNYAMICRVI